MVKRLEFTDSSRTSASLSTNKLDAKADWWIMNHAMPLKVAGSFYKFIGAKHQIESLVSVKKVLIDKNDPTPDIDKMFIVELGGPFEKIGDDDEAIGGGTQKVGSANK
jgi:hypothetical protein